MKTKDSLLSVFLLMFVFIVILYGFYELGGCVMCKCSQIIKLLISIVFIGLLIYLEILFCCHLFCNDGNPCDSNVMYISNGEFFVNSEKIENVFFISDENDIIKNGKKILLY